MPKILRTVSGVTLTQNDGNGAPDWFRELELSPDRISADADYYSLADDGVVYVIENIGGDIKPEWQAFRWLPVNSIEKRGNIFHMCSRGVMAGDVSDSFPTKTKLQEAITSGTITFSSWKEEPSFIKSWRDRCDYKRAKAQAKFDAAGPSATKAVYGATLSSDTERVQPSLQSPDPVAIAEGIQLEKTKSFVVGARVWFGFCMFCFVCVVAAGKVSETWPLGLTATAPGLLGFANLKTVEQQARDKAKKS